MHDPQNNQQIHSNAQQPRVSPLHVSIPLQPLHRAITFSPDQLPTTNQAPPTLPRASSVPTPMCTAGPLSSRGRPGPPVSPSGASSTIWRQAARVLSTPEVVAHRTSLWLTRSTSEVLEAHPTLRKTLSRCCLGGGIAQSVVHVVHHSARSFLQGWTLCMAVGC